MSSPMVVGSEACRDFARWSKLEWMETNGTGPLSMASTAGMNARRYYETVVGFAQGANVSNSVVVGSEGCGGALRMGTATGVNHGPLMASLQEMA